ncbi:CitB Response regulator containing a CheY-like receiver domain and an HTH DNA-binding domain [Candidatus Nanopelagicaceae bacterium]
MKRLLIVDDHAVVRHGLKLACEQNGFEVVATLPTISEARSAIAALNPQIVVVDINLPDGSGFELIQWIRKINNSLPIVVLSLNDSPEYVRAARSSGANAYIVKSAPIEELIAAIQFAISSPHSFSSKVKASTYEFALTAREFDVLALMDKGFSNLQISAQLHISLSTVKTHVSSILQKLSANNRVTALKVARDTGLLT